MDVETARTLITVVETGSFLAAARRLNVTQSTVSARVRELENQLGRRLLDRGRHGAKPTPAGLRFLDHAGTIVRVWQQAQHELSLPDDVSHVLNIGAQVSLWDGLLGAWIGGIRTNQPGMAVRADIGTAESLMHQIVDGTLDLALLYTPRSGPGLVVKRVFNDRLIMVSDRKAYSPEPEPDYILCDWGPIFLAEHVAAFPGVPAPSIRVNAGTVALAHVLSFGGAAYLPERIAAPHLQAGRLFEIEGPPAFACPAFVVHSKRDRGDHVREAVKTIMELAHEPRNRERLT